MNKPTDYSIPALDAEMLLAPVGDWMEEHGDDEVADFLRQVAKRGASFDFGAPVRIKDGDWTESSYDGRARLNFGPTNGPRWISLTVDYERRGWEIFCCYAENYYEGHADSLGEATDRALEFCRNVLRQIAEPLVTSRRDGGADLPG